MTLIDALTMITWTITAVGVALIIMLCFVLIQLNNIEGELRGIRNEMARR